MLVILYIISAVSSVFSAIYIQKRQLKPILIATLIAILTGITFIVTMINKMANNVVELNFWSLFAMFSIVGWISAFLFNHPERIVDYEFCFALMAFVVVMLYPAVFPKYCWETCNEIHYSTEIVFLITSFDETSAEETIYGNGYIVNKVYAYPSGFMYYYYHYINEDGTPIEDSIPVHLTTIEYIDADKSPYLEIITIRDCSGYNPETGNHSLGFADKSYKLYIPENCIKNASATDIS